MDFQNIPLLRALDKMDFQNIPFRALDKMKLFPNYTLKTLDKMDFQNVF